jgi:hypothetical protein
MSDDALKQWAQSHATGDMRSPVAVRVLQLLELQERARTALRYLREGYGGEESEDGPAAANELEAGLNQ